MIAIAASFILNLTHSFLHQPHRRAILDSTSDHLTTLILIISVTFVATAIMMAFLLRLSSCRSGLNARHEITSGVCAICLDDNEPELPIRKLAECGHGFHAECIDEWLKHRRTCPLCRRRVATPRRGGLLREVVGCLLRRGLRCVCKLMDLYLDSQLASAFCDDEDELVS